ncbi:MAG: circadian clock protein KaiC, partial [Proteobacteria bacterium]
MPTTKQKSKSSGYVKTGVTGLDEVFLGGVRENNIILVEGGPGTGKTSLGLEFIYRGAMEEGDPGLIISFELTADKLLRDASGFGWDFASLEAEGKIKVIYTSPVVILEELQSPGGVL